MPWWIWILLGFGLFALEAVTPSGFFIFFFGIAALVVGALEYVGILGSYQAQWLLFSVVSVVSLLLLRPRLMERFRGARGGNTSLPEFVGDDAVLLEDLEPGGTAKAEMRGSSWSARSHVATRLPRGSRCTVKRVDGLTLWVVPQHGE